MKEQWHLRAAQRHAAQMASGILENLASRLVLVAEPVSLPWEWLCRLVSGGSRPHLPCNVLEGHRPETLAHNPTHTQVKGTGIANTCPTIADGSSNPKDLKAGSYSLQKFCLEPTSFTVKEESQVGTAALCCSRSSAATSRTGRRGQLATGTAPYQCLGL